MLRITSSASDQGRLSGTIKGAACRIEADTVREIRGDGTSRATSPFGLRLNFLVGIGGTRGVLVQGAPDVRGGGKFCPGRLVVGVLRNGAFI